MSMRFRVLWFEDQFEKMEQDFRPWLEAMLKNFCKKRDLQESSLELVNFNSAKSVFQGSKLKANLLHEMSRSDLVLLDLNFEDHSNTGREFGWDFLLRLEDCLQAPGLGASLQLPPVYLFSGVELQDHYQEDVQSALELPYLVDVFNKNKIRRAISPRMKSQELSAGVRWVKKKFEEHVHSALAEAWQKQRDGRKGVVIDNAQTDDFLERISLEPVDVFITGDTGTGKEVVARKIFDAMKLPEEKFVAVNCGAIPEGLFEAEFFGWVAGAHSTAMHERLGYFEQAHEGVLFLDEIAELSLMDQVKLLRVLQERKFRRLGESQNTLRESSFRLICATNKDLRKEVEEGRFREDLFFRLFIKAQVHLKPLHERPEEASRKIIHGIFEDLVASENYNKPWLSIEEDFVVWLSRTPVKGNIRGLRAVLETMIALSNPRTLKTLSRGSIPAHCEWMFESEL